MPGWKCVRIAVLFIHTYIPTYLYSHRCIFCTFMTTAFSHPLPTSAECGFSKSCSCSESNIALLWYFNAFLICHLQKQASGNTLGRGIFKELEPCVVFILVFIYCHILERQKALWPLPMQPLLLLPIAKLWAILVEKVGCSCLVTMFPVILKPLSKGPCFGLWKLLVKQGEPYLVECNWILLSEAPGCCHTIILFYWIYSPCPGYHLWLISLPIPCQQSTED